MDLETIKRYDNSWWLRYLETTTVFDAKGIKEQIDWLIEQAEKFERYEKALEGLKEALITTRGENNKHDSEITGLCIQITKVLEGCEWDE